MAPFTVERVQLTNPRCKLHQFFLFQLKRKEPRKPNLSLIFHTFCVKNVSKLEVLRAAIVIWIRDYCVTHRSWTNAMASVREWWWESVCERERKMACEKDDPKYECGCVRMRERERQKESDRQMEKQKDILVVWRLSNQCISESGIRDEREK